ncbi:MAG: hypothetical protein AB7I27_05595 [Bacteriovoracaceae bacterium]
MKRKTQIGPIIFILLLLLITEVFAGIEGCIINFEVKSHPSAAWLDKKLNSLKHVRIIHEATPRDIVDCAKEGALAITIIGHAGDLQNPNQSIAPLLYQKKLLGEDRNLFLKDLKQQLELILNRETLTDAQYSEALFQISKIENLPESTPVYGPPKFVENQIWQTLLENKNKLLKISIASCLPKKVAAYYQGLKLLQQSGIEVNFAPKNKFQSYLKNKEVVSLNAKWIKNSLQIK